MLGGSNNKNTIQPHARLVKPWLRSRIAQATNIRPKALNHRGRKADGHTLPASNVNEEAKARAATVKRILRSLG